MSCKNSNFWIGLGIGSAVGALAYHFSRTQRAKKLKEDVYHAFHKISNEAKEALNSAEEHAMHAGVKAADKVAGKAHEAADKADDLKNKVHDMADHAKK